MMQYPEKTTNELYQNLGRLFYSVAMSDNSVHTREIDKLRSFIRKFWLDVDEVEDEFGEDAAFQIETVFDWYLANEKDKEDAYNEFQEFYVNHQQKFTPFIKILILDTAYAVANSFAGTNKSELVLLSKLRLLMT